MLVIIERATVDLPEGCMGCKLLAGFKPSWHTDRVGPDGLGLLARTGMPRTSTTVNDRGVKVYCELYLNMIVVLM